MKTSRALSLTLLLLLTHIQLCFGQVFTIDVFDFDFGDSTTGLHINPTIQLGETVRWVWVSGFHSTTAAAGQSEAWNSGVLGAGSSFDHVFTQLGTFNYYCIPHGSDLGGGQVSGMSGSVTVVPEPAHYAFLTGALLVGGMLYSRRNRILRLFS